MDELIHISDLADVPSDCEAVMMPNRLWLVVHRESADIVWADALRDRQRLRAAMVAWRDEAERLYREVGALRDEIDSILNPPAADYVVDEGVSGGY